ncbi:MAG: hypothetical protein HZC40_04755 [Chloroflexi bacterium]|nr:hypothetical protein [Chloroflexota bacterium]
MIHAHLNALALREDDPRSFSLIALAGLIALHLIGIAAFWRLLNQPLWLAPITLAILVIVPAAMWKSRGVFAIETLAPLFFLYAILIARYVAIRIVNAPVPYQDESTLANARVLVFQIELAAIAAFAYVVLMQIARLKRVALIWLAIGLCIAALSWFAAETISHRTRGVTGSDPYAYAQMAVDLATRGTPLHRFDLFAANYKLPIPWYPFVHVGYELPINMQGDAATVWPIGGSFWLALMYRVFGEAGLYLATPLAGIASLLMLALFARDFFREQSRLARAAIIAIAVVILATSWEQVDRSLIPLVDTQAQFWTLLALWAAIRRNPKGFQNPSGLIAGLALALAYWIRHTQVLIAPAIVVAVLDVPRRERFRFLAIVASVALVAALPDLWYHREYFGGWLTPESKELALFSFASIAPSAEKLAERFFAGNEFGYLFPFLIYGAYRAAHENRARFFALATWVIVLVAFHLPYVAIRMRDLLPEFPPVILLTAYGIVALARDLRAKIGNSGVERLRGFSASEQPAKASSPFAFVLTGFAIFLALLLFLTRTQFTLMRVVQPAKVTFGYVTAAQRAAFDQIAALTPSNAVIASEMNDGAIDLYAHRATARIGDWTPDERAQFVEKILRENRPLFLLDDGAHTSAARRELASRYTLNQIAILNVPLFGVVDAQAGVLYQVLP